MSTKVKVLVGLLVTVGICMLVCRSNDASFKEGAAKYKACVLEQSRRQGWITRSSCSLHWREYDEYLGLTYKQVGLDIYLTSEVE